MEVRRYRDKYTGEMILTNESPFVYWSGEIYTGKFIKIDGVTRFVVNNKEKSKFTMGGNGIHRISKDKKKLAQRWLKELTKQMIEMEKQREILLFHIKDADTKS